jgi:hypothetical protein
MQRLLDVSSQCVARRVCMRIWLGFDCWSRHNVIASVEIDVNEVKSDPSAQAEKIRQSLIHLNERIRIATIFP